MNLVRSVWFWFCPSASGEDPVLEILAALRGKSAVGSLWDNLGCRKQTIEFLLSVPQGQVLRKKN